MSRQEDENHASSSCNLSDGERKDSTHPQVEISSFKNSVEAYLSSLNTLQNTLNLLRRQMPADKLEDEFTASEYSLFNAAVTYTLCSLFYSYLKVIGQDGRAHPINQELERVQIYLKKIASLPSFKGKRNLAVDREAVGRIIGFYTSSRKDSEKSTSQVAGSNSQDKLSSAGVNELSQKSVECRLLSDRSNYTGKAFLIDTVLAILQQDSRWGCLQKVNVYFPIGLTTEIMRSKTSQSSCEELKHNQPTIVTSLFSAVESIIKPERQSRDISLFPNALVTQVAKEESFLFGPLILGEHFQPPETFAESVTEMVIPLSTDDTIKVEFLEWITDASTGLSKLVSEALFNQSQFAASNRFKGAVTPRIAISLALANFENNVTFVNLDTWDLPLLPGF